MSRRSRTVRRMWLGSGAAVLVAGLTVVLAQEAPADRYWAQWRGPDATGLSRSANPPLEWSETRNVRWKAEIPGRGTGSPIVWGDRLFLLTAVPEGVDGDATHQPRGGLSPRDVHRFVVMAVNRADGSVAWERTVFEGRPHEAAHPTNGTYASSSAVTDGEIVIASFESQGLYAFDLDGTPVWQKDLGDKSMRQEFGEGSTPVLYGDRLVVVWDHLGQSFVAGLDKNTGHEVWRVERDEIDTWATPLVVEHDGRHQVIVPGMNRVHAYDLDTGDVVWFSDGLTMNPIPSPVAGDGLVFVTSGFRGNDLKAIRIADAHGDITNSDAIVWSLDRDTPYVPSPLLYDGILYLLKSNSGILSAFDAPTGGPHYQNERVTGVPNMFASPVGAAGRVYLAGRDGTVAVLRHGPTLEVLATNQLDDGFDASPALVEDEIYLRGYRYLYCIAAG